MAVKNLENVKLESTSLTTQQAESLFAAITEVSHLKSLDISYNNLSSGHGCQEAEESEFKWNITDNTSIKVNLCSHH